MAKRFTDTEKWKDPWYISLDNDYRIIWQWLIDNCSHAGFCKRNMSLLNLMCRFDTTEHLLLKKMENRVLIVGNDWFIPKFIKFQYSTLKSGKPAILGVVKELFSKNCIGLIPESFGNDYLIIAKSFQDHCKMIKDKDKDYREEVGGKEDDKGVKGGKEGETGEEVGVDERMLLPQMHALWKASFPMYTPDIDFDYPALRGIAVFIFKTAGVKNAFGNVDAEIKVLNTFQLIADQVNREPFWVNKPLSSIAKNIQEFYNKLKNPQDGNGKSKTAGVNDDKLKQKVADHLSQRRQQNGGQHVPN
jgi:hypothetical protein